jgi:hypothetical protein
VRERRSSVSSIDMMRRLRVIGLLDAAERIGVTPLALEPLHVIAYFTDALAPVWNVPVLDGQILKQIRPYYPALQSDVDALVGCGVVAVSDVRYVGARGHWRLEAKYQLNRRFADHILSAAEAFPLRRAELEFVREVVYATSGLGTEGLHVAGEADATYSDPLVDVGGLIEVERDRGEGYNSTATAAMRFGELLGAESQVSTAEMVNLYVRRLYSRLHVA